MQYAVVRRRTYYGRSRYVAKTKADSRMNPQKDPKFMLFYCFSPAGWFQMGCNSAV